ncbi:RNase P modulator RnpM [Desulfitobacterium sp. AusDCA]|uniref:RNase P modulator RnpM n=1 Tax=Desulfitobacterium sp. AusDCA TaxID=3240383 RepID=UPI003DA7A1CF
MKVRKIPMRMCLGCQEMKPKKELVRIVRTPEGTVELDPTGKRNGRGAYICPQVECLKAAVKGNRFQKALDIALSPELIQELEGKLADS